MDAACPYVIAADGQAALTLDWGWLIVFLLAQLVIAIATGLLVSQRITTRLAARQEAHDEQLGDHESRLTAAEKAVQDRHIERLQCEVRAGREFALRGELSRLVADNTTQYKDLVERIDHVGGEIHHRVTNVVDRVSHLEGRKRQETPT